MVRGNTMSEFSAFCMGCMGPSNGHGNCPRCGYPAGGVNPPEYAAVRTVLCDRYLIGRVLRIGGGTALYLGYDVTQKTVVRIREFCPDVLCERKDGKVVPRGGCDNVFADYTARFLQHARKIAQLRDLPCSVPIYDIFEANGTAYVVEDDCRGSLLEQWLMRNGKPMVWDEIRPAFMTLLGTVIAYHEAGVYHLGISPRNIIIGKDERLHLTDWFIPSARRVGGEIKPELETGYAAPELYAFGASFGPAADVYSLTAVLFRLLTGKNPPDRALSGHDTGLMIPVEVARELPDTVKAALTGGLRVAEGQRIPTVAALRDALSLAPAVAQLQKEEQDSEPQPETTVKKKKRGGAVAVIILVIFLLLICLAGATYIVLAKQGIIPDYLGVNVPSEPTSSETPPVSSEIPPVSSEFEGTTYEVDDVLGMNAYEAQGHKFKGSMTVQVVGKVFSDTVPKGTIVSQSPQAGEMMPAETVIEVWVSMGPASFEMPDVSGWTAEAARAYLEALGLRVGVRLVEVSSFDKGLVQETSPVAGATVKDGQLITIVVSNVNAAQ